MFQVVEKDKEVLQVGRNQMDELGDAVVQPFAEDIEEASTGTNDGSCTSLRLVHFREQIKSGMRCLRWKLRRK